MPLILQLQCTSNYILSYLISHVVRTTPAAPAVIAIGAVTALSPDEHITGILTALEIEYADASVGVA